MNLSTNQHYLDSVILKIDFEQIKRFTHKEFEETFHKKYPEKNIVEQNTETKEVFLNNRRILDQRNFPVYKYFDNKNNNFGVSDVFCFFEFKKYIGYENLKTRFLEALKILKKEPSFKYVSRIGFRYINILKGNLKKCVHEYLLSNNKFFDFISKNRKSSMFQKSINLNRLSYRNDDNSIDTTFLFGNYNENYPSPLEKENFLLDYDAVCLNVNENEVDKKLDAMHEIIESLFFKSITSSLKKELQT